ncbi:hypothetical protein ACIHFE_21305 [Streptomyces sp. NPDC052396]|uniref:hypothetical protein n=1 Tax=Streptomyces sp. NPDC052396 TaxID=3365689 RepID=UPI0037D6927D
METRGFDRELPYRALYGSELWSVFAARCAGLAEVTATVESDAATRVLLLWGAAPGEPGPPAQ